jgi:hypothetical protein
MGNILAGESSAYDVGTSSGEVLSGEVPNVIVDGDTRPVLGEDAPTERIDFAERDGSHSGPFEAETKSADAGKEVEDIH